MEQYGKVYTYSIYEDAGHGYMRTGDDPEGSEADVTARNQSWERVREILVNL